jgi:hypothetical protein
MIRIELQHLVVELSRGRARLGYALEIADVLPGLFDDTGVIVLLGFLMSGDNRAWVERLDCIESSDPLAAGLRVRLYEVRMNVVVGVSPATTRPTDGTCRHVVWSVSRCLSRSSVQASY